MTKKIEDEPIEDEPIEDEPVDRIIRALTEIAAAMQDGGIEEFNLSVGKLFKFTGRKGKLND